MISLVEFAMSLLAKDMYLLRKSVCLAKQQLFNLFRLKTSNVKKKLQHCCYLYTLFYNFKYEPTVYRNESHPYLNEYVVCKKQNY